MSRTKLVCTIGPASRDRIEELVAVGMDVARLNFSHGDAEQHTSAAAAVRAAAETAGRQVAILADLPGPKIRLGSVPGDALLLEGGGDFRLASAGAAAGARPDVTATTHPDLAGDLRGGDRVMLSDGAVELRVSEIEVDTVVCEVVRGGTVRSGAGVNMPSERLSLPPITDRDRDALEVAQDLGVDYVAMSFVRRAGDIAQLRALMGERAIPIVAKIETRAAVDGMAAVLDAADAVMLARGDLGVEIPFAEVPIVQKRLIRSCVAAGVPVIVATQMLESMVSSPRPTRAEASDVANAVLDGTDAVMLSAETAIGVHPVLAARAAIEICETAEREGERVRRREERQPAGDDAEAAAVAMAAVTLAEQVTDPRVAAIACFTRTGLTARLLAALRPTQPIHTLTPDPEVARRLALYRGVSARTCTLPDGTDELLALLETSMRQTGLASGARVVLVASIPFGRARTNFLKLHRLG